MAVFGRDLQLFLTFVTIIKFSSAGESAGYTYGSEERWGDHCNSGFQQSPIDIIEPRTTSVVNQPLKIPEASKNVTLTKKESDSTLKYAFPTVMGTMYDFVVPVTGKSTGIKQLHFHWGGSEHLVNAMRYALECHLVTAAIDHLHEDTTILTVFARLFTLGEENAAVEKLISAHENKNETIAGFDLSDLYPESIEHLFLYRGSLTTPPCTEGVRWVVVQEPLTVSLNQLERLKSLQLVTQTVERNFRTVQSVNDRTVERYNILGSSALGAPTLAPILFSLTLLIHASVL